MENFNLNFQKLAKSNQKTQKLGKNGNVNYFPTASPKSYWELGSQVPIQFPRLRLRPEHPRGPRSRTIVMMSINTT